MQIFVMIMLGQMIKLSKQINFILIFNNKKILILNFKNLTKKEIKKSKTMSLVSEKNKDYLNQRCLNRDFKKIHF